MVGINIVQPELYEKFIRGGEAHLFVTTIKNLNQHDMLGTILLSNKETFYQLKLAKKLLI